MLQRILLGVAGAAVATMLVWAPGFAQQTGAQPAAQPQAIKRTVLETHDVPGTNYQIVFGMAEIGPNADVAKHTHPGSETGYVLDGSLDLEVQGEATRTLQKGQSYFVASGVAHGGRAGPNGAKALATWVVEKGKPLAAPAK